MGKGLVPLLGWRRTGLLLLSDSSGRERGSGAADVATINGRCFDILFHLAQKIDWWWAESWEGDCVADGIQSLDLLKVRCQFIGAIDGILEQVHGLLGLEPVHFEEQVHNAHNPLTQGPVKEEALLGECDDRLQDDAVADGLPLRHTAHNLRLRPLQARKQVQQLVHRHGADLTGCSALPLGDVKARVAVQIYGLVYVDTVHADPGTVVPRVRGCDILVVFQLDRPAAGAVGAIRLPHNLAKEGVVCLSHEAVHSYQALEGDQPSVVVVGPLHQL
mmetsp:Transcript_17629/g.49275  ORF Transcript_17629/g.49275 Transcript_17629/m.49275 type:complete len:275 (+) Transcript_17629:1256-2080(+)